MLLFNLATVESFDYQNTDPCLRDFSTLKVILMCSDKTVKKLMKINNPVTENNLRNWRGSKMLLLLHKTKLSQRLS